jgi:outer membrane receptor for ferric coprogen and ferric-rhodotorulic acid
MPLTQIRETALNAAQKVANALDWAHFRMGVQKLFQSLAHYFRTLASLTFG